MSHQFVGKTFGSHYRVESVLGQKSGRRTLLAKNTENQTLVVIKLVLFGPDFTWEDLKLFEREAETLKSLNHPAIPQYLDSFEVETPIGKGFALVQTYIEAKSLQEWVSAGYTFSEDELYAIALDLLHILDYLHHRHPPVIHRDIKPSNILIPAQNSQTNSGIYLVDFGSVQTAPSLGTMTVVGTYGYMPPEQFGGRAVPASDIYSTGATLIYLATGQHPAELIQSDLHIDFERQSNLTEPFVHWIKRLICIDLAKRPSSAQQALYQLQHPQALSTQAHLHSTSHLPPLSSQHLPLRQSRAGFKTNFQPNQLTIEFSQARLKGSLLSELYEGMQSIGLLMQQAEGIVGFLCFGIIFLSIELEVINPGLAIVILAVIACPLILFALSLYNTTAKITLVYTSDKNIKLSLTQPSKKTFKRPRTNKKQLALSDLKIDALTISAQKTRYQLGFNFTSDPFPKKEKLQIVGSRRDTDWLRNFIVQWKNIPVYYDEIASG
ncbi:MAG: serine/threonine-protein kinase [Cyanobacteria bacterium P01_C01_bin.69]